MPSLWGWCPFEKSLICHWGHHPERVPSSNDGGWGILSTSMCRSSRLRNVCDQYRTVWPTSYTRHHVPGRTVHLGNCSPFDPAVDSKCRSLIHLVSPKARLQQLLTSLVIQPVKVIEYVEYLLRFIHTEWKRTRNFFFDLSRCSMWTLNWILYEHLEAMSLHLRSNINEHLGVPNEKPSGKSEVSKVYEKFTNLSEGKTTMFTKEVLIFIDSHKYTTYPKSKLPRIIIHSAAVHEWQGVLHCLFVENSLLSNRTDSSVSESGRDDRGWLRCSFHGHN